MYHRIFDIENRLDEAMFLFGGRISRRSGDVDLYYVTDFFKALWAGKII